jgi:hypothetical protein
MSARKIIEDELKILRAMYAKEQAKNPSSTNPYLFAVRGQIEGLEYALEIIDETHPVISENQKRIQQ